ncbi:SpoIIE family protein phosphatase [Kitasatospora sp. NPDC096147]|uniref:SpoIIE family protein phosphatase n=1 Tax=Kitasatospora sp. NPDC096147 TaxID=3364093 RepID=UPI0038251894
MTADHSTDGAATVLVLDDNDVNRYLIRSRLTRHGHTVLEARDGTEALAMLAAADDRELPELAVVDVRLPDMSGFEVCERIKADPRTAAIPVVHVSATAIEVADRAQGLHRGADAYLTEPIAPTELLATVTAVLRYARARRRAERLATRVTTLNRTTLAVYEVTGAEAFAARAAAGTATLMDSPALALALSPHGGTLHLAAADRPGREGDAPPRLSRAPVGLLDQLADRVLGDATGAETAVLPRADWQQLAARLDGPVADLLPGDVAVLLARTKQGRPPVALLVDADALANPDDRGLFAQLGHTCGLALEAVRVRSEEHALVLTLQRTFLPDRLPEVEGVDLAVRYEPAAAHTEIGGDFYEAIETPAGLLLAIGDVAGHSLHAAMVMGELRHALRAYAIEGHDPQTLLDRLDALLVRLRPAMTATVCLVLVEPGGRRVRIANAGHLPPLLRYPDGSTRYLTEHGILLGLNLPHPAPVTHEVPPGSTLLLLTDGLVEVAGEDLDEGLRELADAVSASSQELDELCDGLLADFGKAKTDDIALLAARLH